MSNMILHCGAKQVELPEVLAVPTPEPTRTHVPIPHAWFIENILDALSQANIEASDWSYALNHQGQQMFAMARIKGDLAGDRDEGVLACRNAHDKAYKASLAYGRRVFCCDNLGFSGEVVVGRKHTPGILDTLPDLLFAMVNHISGLQDYMAGRYDSYEHEACNDAFADQLFAEMVRRRIFPDMQTLYAAMYYWENPTHEQFAAYSMWRLFNAVTESLKNREFPNPGRTMRLHRLVDEACGLTIEDAEFTVQ